MTSSKNNNKRKEKHAEEFRGQVLSWYDENRRVLPWRAGPKEKPDPYCVWLSEIMLQQTTVNAVIPYFSKFIEKWPNVEALAQAEREDVMAAWAGLGYYARARNLHQCAQMIANDMGGDFPQEQKELQKLPGIGDYTSAAIASIAFNRPANVVDGNIERIMARYFLVRAPLPGSKKKLKALAGDMADGDQKRPGDYAQGLMDLGAAICTPQSPRCEICPVKAGCRAYKQGVANDLPVRKKKADKPQRLGFVYWIENDQEEVLLHQRPAKGLLGGMKGLPTTEWIERGANYNPAHPKDFAVFDFTKGQSIYHSFTHFDLELVLHRGKTQRFQPKQDYFWAKSGMLKKAGFPTVFRKAYKIFTVKLK